MKLLYCHDHKLKVYKNLYYSNGSFTTEVFERYNIICKEITFLSRQEFISEAPRTLTLISGDNIFFEKVEDFKSIKKFKNINKSKKTIQEKVLESDIIIARLPSSIGNISVKYAEKYNIPYLIEVVGCPWDSMRYHGSILAKILAPILYLKMKHYVKNADYVSYITRQFLQTRYPTNGKQYIAPNVVIKEVSNNILIEKINRIRYKKNDDIFIFGLIGSLDVGYKGHIEVIKAFNIIKKEYPEIKFRVEFVGGGKGLNLKYMVNKLNLNSEIIFKGTLPSGEKIFEWLDSIDIGLQPSSAEAQGRSIIESMSRGNPVIASKVGGIIELLDEEFLINPGNFIDLKEKILKLIFNKNIMIQQSCRNFNEAKAYYKDTVEYNRNKLLKDFKQNIT